mgnify:CR=1 FL=1
MAEQLAYTSATIERQRGPGNWQIVDPLLQASEEHEVLNDLDDSTYLESDGSWVGGTRPSVLMRVQTLPGKLPLRRPHIAATVFRLRVRYRITGSGTFGIGPLVEVVDYAGDHPNVAAVPFPGRRSVLVQQTFTSELIYDGAEHEFEMTLPGFMLRGHEDGWRHTDDLGVWLSVPSTFTGAPSLQVIGCWYRVDEVEKGESVSADWLVVRAGPGDFRTVDLKGNWAGTPGQVFTTLFQSSPSQVLNNGALALADAGRRAGLTKQFSGTAIVEFDPSVYANAQSNLSAQPNIGGVIVGGRSGSATNYIYWRSGTPAAPGGLVPVDGLVIRTPPVSNGYRNGNDRVSIGGAWLDYHYDGTFVDNGTISYYGVRFWVDAGGTRGIGSEFSSGKPGGLMTLDLHDFQVSGTFKTTGSSEYTWGMRMGAIRLDMRHGFFGRSQEHAIYTSSPVGDSQIVEVENTFAASFYPKHTTASTTPGNPNSFHQLVNRTNSCQNVPGATPSGSTPPGAGTLLVESCTSRNTGGTDFKCVHTLGTIINRRCKSFAGSGTQRAVQFTVESFLNIGNSVFPFGVDYSVGTYDAAAQTPCTVAGGSGLANPAVPYPLQVPANGPLVYCFKKVVIEDLQVNGTYGNTVCQIAGAKEIIIDRGSFSGTSKRPIFGFWEWNWDSGGDLASWNGNGCGAFDNNGILFRNVGTDPHAFYAPGTTTNNGVTVSRLAVYGARSNPNKPGGIVPTVGNPAHLTPAQLQALTVPGNTSHHPWYQTQKVDPGSAGGNLGHDWVYPCVTAPDLEDPAVYGGYLAFGRRYPNKNTLFAGMESEWESPVINVTLGSGGATSVNVGTGEFEFEAPSPTVTQSTEVTAAGGEFEFEAPVPSVSLAYSVTVGTGEFEFEAPAPIVVLGTTVDFSLYPARILLTVGLPEVLSEALESVGDGSTDAASLCGAASGGAS